MSNGVPLRDTNLNPLVEADICAARILERLRTDERTAKRMADGLLSPIEIARIAAEMRLSGAI